MEGGRADEADNTGRGERGSVTVELAVGFVAVLIMVAIIASVAGIGLTRSSLCSAVREAARSASIGQGDPVSAALRAYTRSGAAPEFTVERQGRWVTAEGTVHYSGLAGIGHGRATCTATTMLEQAVP